MREEGRCVRRRGHDLLLSQIKGQLFKGQSGVVLVLVVM